MTVRELQNELLELKRSSASNTVAAALLSLQQELAKPPPVFDPYRALAGLESLVPLLGTKRMQEPNGLAQFSVSAALSSAIRTSKAFFSSWLGIRRTLK